MQVWTSACSRLISVSEACCRPALHRALLRIAPDTGAGAGGESALLKFLAKDATANFRQSHGESAHETLASLFTADLGTVSSQNVPFNSSFRGFSGSPSAGIKAKHSFAPLKSIEKADSLVRWPMLGDLAKLQGLTSISSLISGQEQTTLTSVFIGDKPASVTPPAGSPKPLQKESTFNRRDSQPAAAPGAPMPPHGHGGGSTDVAACPFMA